MIRELHFRGPIDRRTLLDMGRSGMPENIRTESHFWGVWIPLATIVIILGADWAEGPKTAFVGVLAVVPMLSAVFASPRATALVAGVTWVSALLFGLVAADGNTPAQYVRLAIIALVGVAAFGAATLRSRMQRELTRAQIAAAEAESAKREANHDWLTGVLNRRGLDAEFDRRREDEQRGVVIMLDLDGMKRINDEHGHAVGDEAIKAVADRIRYCVQDVDAVGRWGGDEFVVVADVDRGQGRVIAERIESHVAEQPIHTSTGKLQARVSSGVAPFAPEGTIDDALTEADADMYRRKRRALT